MQTVQCVSAHLVSLDHLAKLMLMNAHPILVEMEEPVQMETILLLVSVHLGTLAYLVKLSLRIAHLPVVKMEGPAV